MIETRRGELRRLPGRRLEGTVMAYGSEALIGGVRERFSMFAFDGWLRSGAETRLNVMHQPDLVVASRRRGDLVLLDSPAALSMRAELPTGDAYDSVLSLVGEGLTRGLSVEFNPLEERRTNGVRVVQRATLPGLGIVDEPAYQQSAVEVRVGGRGLSGAFHYGRDRVTNDRGPRRKVRVSSGAFSWQLEAFQELQRELGDTLADAFDAAADEVLRERLREVQLLAGRNYEQPLASLRRGTLILEDTPDALRFEVERLPDSTYAQDLHANLDAGAADFGVEALYSIPPADVVADAVTIETEPGTGVEIEVVRRAVLQALAVVSRAPRGNGGMVERRRQAGTPARRRRIWI